MITTSRPVYEFKCIDPTFVQQLQELGVYLRSTNLTTVDTVEIGMFIGLHPSLTNIEWRVTQINTQLGYDNQIPVFEIYRRRLRMEEVSTNTIVLRCSKADQEKLETQFLELKPEDLGKNVEFIPYKILNQMTTQEKKTYSTFETNTLRSMVRARFRGSQKKSCSKK